MMTLFGRWKATVCTFYIRVGVQCSSDFLLQSFVSSADVAHELIPFGFPFKDISWWNTIEWTSTEYGVTNEGVPVPEFCRKKSKWIRLNDGVVSINDGENRSAVRRQRKYAALKATLYFKYN